MRRKFTNTMIAVMVSVIVGAFSFGINEGVGFAAAKTPGKVTVTSATTSFNSIILKWKKPANAKTYQVSTVTTVKTWKYWKKVKKTKANYKKFNVKNKYKTKVSGKKYNVYRYLDTNSYKVIKSLTACKYIYKGKFKTTYRFAVRAVNGKKYGAWSTVKSVTTPACTHQWSAWKTVKAPTCTEDGESTRSCSLCKKVETNNLASTGHEYVDIAIPASCTEDGSEYTECAICHELKPGTEKTVLPAFGHEWGEWEVLTNATCKSDGEKVRYCKHDNAHVQKEAIEKKEHQWAEEYTIDIAPTCTQAGEKSIHCTACGERKAVTEIPPAGHNFTAWETKNVQCESFKERSCTECGTTETELLGENHSWEDEYTIDSPPSCLIDGSESVHCSVCGAQKDSRVIPAPGHKYKSKAVKQPTCKDEGYTLFVCEECGDSYTEPIEKTEHSWNSGEITRKANCSMEGIKTFTCETCGDTYTESIGYGDHEWGTSPYIKKNPTCTNDGKEQYRCTVCGALAEAKVIPALGHNYKLYEHIDATCTANGMDTYRCENCGLFNHVEIEATGHHYSDEYTIDREATCARAGLKSRHCENCDARTDTVSIPATGHQWDEGTVIKECTCTEDGEILYTCEKCGATNTEYKPGEHEWADDYTVDVEPTCTAAGEKSIHCKNCDAKKDVTTIAKFGHDNVEIERIDPTCTSTGKIVTKCSRCGKETTTTKKALGHEYKWILAKEASYTEQGYNIYACTRCGQEKEEGARQILPKLMTEEELAFAEEIDGSYTELYRNWYTEEERDTTPIERYWRVPDNLRSQYNENIEGFDASDYANALPGWKITETTDYNSETFATTHNFTAKVNDRTITWTILERDYLKENWVRYVEDFFDKYITDGMTEYEKAAAVLANGSATFKYTNGPFNDAYYHNYDPMTMIITGYGVCEARAKYVKNFLRRMGIQCYTAAASLDHADVCAILDGKIYYLDCMNYNGIRDTYNGFHMVNGAIAQYLTFEAGTTAVIPEYITYPGASEPTEIKKIGWDEGSIFHYATTNGYGPKKLIIPKSVQTITEGALECRTLEEVVIDEENPYMYVNDDMTQILSKEDGSVIYELHLKQPDASGN